MDQIDHAAAVASTVQVVADDPAMRDALRALFEVRGLRVESFADIAAFRFARDPAMGGCLVVDLKAPEAGDLDAVRELFASGFGAPTILLSGRFGTEAAMRPVGQGTALCLGKPLDPAKLLAAVERSLRRGQAPAGR
jgi:two-component system CheB/CheR fusion protein